MDIQGMQWLDWLIVVIMGLSVTFGLVRGLIREALSLASWILAVFLGMSFSHQLGAHFGKYVTSPSIANAVGFILIFIATLIVGSLVARMVAKLFHSIGLSGTDRLLGILFGFFRGVLIVGVLIMLGEAIGLSSNPAWKASQLKSYWDSVVVLMHDWMHDQDLPITLPTIPTPKKSA